MTLEKQEETFLRLLGKRIREERIKKGLSQEKLSFEANLDRTYVSELERGIRNAAIVNLRKIARALKVPLARLLRFDRIDCE